MPYDLFISYSRRDNEQGRITQLVERIKADFVPFANRELVTFFDQQEIDGIQDWGGASSKDCTNCALAAPRPSLSNQSE